MLAQLYEHEYTLTDTTLLLKDRFVLFSDNGTPFTDERVKCRIEKARFWLYGHGIAQIIGQSRIRWRLFACTSTWLLNHKVVLLLLRAAMSNSCFTFMIDNDPS